MPHPTGSLATLRPDLATLYQFDVAANQQGMIAHRIFPVVEVASQAGNFGIIPVEQFLQKRNTKRAPGSGYSRGNFKFKPAAYLCEENGVEEPVDDRSAKAYADYFDAEAVATIRALNAVLTDAEQRVADVVFDTNTFENTAAATAWSDHAGADPIADVEKAVKAVYEQSGLIANALTFNYWEYRNVRHCESVIDRINSAGAGSPSKASDVTYDMLAAVFDIPYIVVAGMTMNAAAEGKQFAPEQVWGNDKAMVCRISNSADMADPCIGRTFHWAEDGSTVGGTVETYRDESVRSNIVRVRHDTDEKVLYKEAGHLITGI